MAKFKLQPSDRGMLIIPLLVGRKEWRFLVDTGAWAPMVSPELIRAVIGGEPAIKVPTAVNGPLIADAYETPFELILAGVATDSVVVSAFPTTFFDGVIGTYNLSKFQTVKFDFKNMELELGLEASGEVEMCVSDRRHECGSLMLHCHGCKEHFCIGDRPVYCPNCGLRISEGSLQKLKQGFEEGISPKL